MNLFEAFGVIKLKDDSFSSGLSKASTTFGKFAKSSVDGTVKLTNGIIKGMAVAGVAAVGFGVAAVKVGMDYEQSMAQVAATMGITADKSDADYAKMSKAAKDAGASTKFSAGEAADALNYLALAGFSVTDATATMPKILNLAAAGNMDLAYASDLVTDSMSALGLGVEDVDSFIDQMAKTSQKSNTSVSQLGEGMLTVGGLAKGMAGGTVELSTALGILADNGVKGSEGGTKVRNMLIELSNPTSKATKGLKGMGIEAYDLEGNLRPLPEIFGDMNSAMDGMTMEEKREIIGKMFNKQDMAAVEAFLGTTPERWDDLSNAIANSDGTAQQMATTMQQTLKGSFDQLKSAMSVFAIDFYEGFNTPLTGGVLAMADFVNNARSTMTSLQFAVEQGAISSGDAINMFAEVFGEGLSGMVAKAIEYIPQIIEAAGSFITGFITGLTSNIGQIASTATQIINTFYESLANIFPLLAPMGVQIIMTLIEGFIAHYGFIFTSGVELITQLLQGLAEGLPQLMPIALDAINSIVDGLMTNFPLIIEAGVSIITQLLGGLGQAIPQLVPMAIMIITTIVDGILQLLPQILEVALLLIMEFGKGLAAAAPQLITGVAETITTLVTMFLQQLPFFIPVALQIIVAIADGLIQAIPILIPIIPEIVGAIINALIISIPALSVAAIQLFMAIVKAIPPTIDAIIMMLPQLIMSIINFLISAISQLATAALNMFKAIPDAIPKIIGNVASNLANVISNIISAVTGWIARVASVALQVFKSLPDAIPKIIGNISSNLANVASNIISAVTGWIARVASVALQVFKAIPDAIPKMIGQLSSALTSIVSKITGAFDGLPGKMVGIGKDLINGLISGIGSMAGAVIDKVKGLASAAMDGFKSMFKISSPSRVMMELGGYVTEGLAIGIENEKDSLIDAAENTFGSVLDVLADLTDQEYNYDVGINANASLVGDGLGGGVDGTNGTVTNITQNIYGSQQNPADLLAEARRQQELAVLLNV